MQHSSTQSYQVNKLEGLTQSGLLKRVAGETDYPGSVAYPRGNEGSGALWNFPEHGQQDFQNHCEINKGGT